MKVKLGNNRNIVINPEPVAGNIYQCVGTGELYIAVKGPGLGGTRLFSLSRGMMLTDDDTYGNYICIDVTNQYCVSPIDP